MDVQFLIQGQHALKLPKNVHESPEVIELIQKNTHGKNRSNHYAPYKRMADFWYASILFALINRLNPNEVDLVDTHSFVKIGPTDSDVKLDNDMLRIMVLVAAQNLKPNREGHITAANVLEVCNKYACCGSLALLSEFKYSGDVLLPGTIRIATLFQNLLENQESV